MSSTPKTDLTIPTLFGLKGKVALVTGGGTGIGKDMARALVQNGAKVYIASRKKDVLEKTAAEFNQMGPGSCHTITADLSNRAGCEAMAKAFLQHESALHVLINCSGMTWGSELENFDEPNGWDRLMALNVKGVFYSTTALLPALRRGARGNEDPARVINISSVAGIAVNAANKLSGEGRGTWSYSASKAAVMHLTSVLARQFVYEHITVNAILPGIFPSNMTAYGLKNNHDEIIRHQPTGRFGSSEDIAGTALYLCSRAGSHATANQIVLDGGSRLVPHL
ncbi:hypothetical protein CXG81DRAFT_15154 [Caulochytrium protostelioides]|uniref:NAD(P)-binding protein n=1 Tax=Caulochytrium protostelioides TaxID=1555241 RepID=A0A4P9X1H4_9FUNG|nr:hypothetical protein CXG81DRAFT_15154 [Caulochytrium protostelioides]|eukprot:RKO99012.1 hypothetical protein CXG81DRAFT_15154 [Caulochytrium protostelioides]